MPGAELIRTMTAAVKLLMFARRNPDETHKKLCAGMSACLANVLVQHLDEVTGKSFVYSLSALA